MLPYIDKKKIKYKKTKEALARNIVAISNDIERPIQEYRCYIVPGDTMVELTASRDQAYEGQARWAWNTLKPVYDVRIDKINKWSEVRLSYRSEMIQNDFRFIIEMMRKMQDSDFYAYSVILERLQWLTNQYRIEQDWRENAFMRDMLKMTIKNKNKKYEMILSEEERKWEISNDMRKAEINRKAQLRAAQEAKEMEFDLFAKVELPQIICRITGGELFYSACIYNSAQGLLQKKLYSLIFSDGATEVLQGSQNRFLNAVMRKGWGDPTAAAERRASTLYQIMNFSEVLQNKIASQEQPAVNRLQAGMAFQTLFNANAVGNQTNQVKDLKMLQGQQYQQELQQQLLQQQISQQIQQQKLYSPVYDQSVRSFSSQQSLQNTQNIPQIMSQQMQQLLSFQMPQESPMRSQNQSIQSPSPSCSSQQFIASPFLNSTHEITSKNNAQIDSSHSIHPEWQLHSQQQQQQQQLMIESATKNVPSTIANAIDFAATQSSETASQVFPYKLLGMSQARVELTEGTKTHGHDMEIRSFDGYSIFGRMRDVTVFKYSGSELIGMATIFTFEMPDGAIEALRKSRLENQHNDGREDMGGGGEDDDMSQFEYNLQVKKFLKKFNISKQFDEQREEQQELKRADEKRQSKEEYHTAASRCEQE